MTKFTHLHVHSHYSMLDGMGKIPDLIDKCVKSGMNAMALTDHGNMYGVKDFFNSSKKYNKKIKEKIAEQTALLNADLSDDERAKIENNIEQLQNSFFKPIFGCEAYVARQTKSNPEGSRKVVSGKENMRGYHLILLAKNETGYKNLCKIISMGWIDGFFSCPRIDRELLETYSEGLIVASACLGGELHKKIEDGDIAGATAAARWYKTVFADDFYIEMQRHKTDKPMASTDVYEKQTAQNPILLQIAAELDIPIIATNDVHFVEEAHAEAHDRLICLSTGAKYKDEKRLHYTKQEWLKTPQEMEAIFSDLPDALSNTMKIAQQVEEYSLDKGAMMPVFDIDADFGTEEQYRRKYSHQDLIDEFESDEEGKGRIERLGGFDKVYRIKLESDYLRKLTFDGAKQRYGETIPDDILERINFELSVMRNMGFPGYFLIVQDFIQAAREMGVAVGPGRGSAAGSVVAYCLKITDIDPLKYDLLFERFLNPDRISLPDIDIDFDDEGRAKVLEYVTQKYGSEKVAHIVTFGTMATKSSIKDVARVQDYPLKLSNELAAMVPDRMPEDPKKGKPFPQTVQNCIDHVTEMKQVCNGPDKDAADVLQYAALLEGTIRQTGVHACGVIIGSDDLTNHVPISTAEDKELGKRINTTQFEGSDVESVGLIKMDFLGLKTLSIVKEAIENIKKTKSIAIDIDAIDMEDKKTYNLYSSGDTIGIFQFESPGMQKYLKELKPTRFEDLIAMNALYRPGPMNYIPQFIARKNGKESISYDIPVMEKYLSDTYGITVYQEQVMLLSRLLGNFSRGKSDELRKAMGKKKKDIVDKLKPEFIKGGIENGHKEDVLNKIWSDWEKFAEYAFNKSHATCYSWLSYQTAFLKANYPAEFMAANLTNNLNEVTEIAKLIDDCKKRNIDVLGPDINESDLHFTVNDKGQIRFGLAAIKGVGEGAVSDILLERKENGKFNNTVDFFHRVNLRSCNKKALESLAKAGTFDNLGDSHRAQFFYEKDGITFLERLIKYASTYQTNRASKQTSLFDDAQGTDSFDSEVSFPEISPWNLLTQCQKEREVTGFYISGHPLNDHRVVINSFMTGKIAELYNPQKLKEMLTHSKRFAVIVSSGTVRMGKTGNEYGTMKLEDLTGVYEMQLFGESFLKGKGFCQDNLLLTLTLKTKMAYPKKDAQGKIIPQTGDKCEDYRIEVEKIGLLSDVLEKEVKKIMLTMDSDVVDHDFVEQLNKVLTNHEQKNGTPVEVAVFDRNLGSVRFNSPFRVDAKSFVETYLKTYPSDTIYLK